MAEPSPVGFAEVVGDEGDGDGGAEHQVGLVATHEHAQEALDAPEEPLDLVAALGVSRQSVYEMRRERRGVSPEMCLRLARPFCGSEGFWLDLQRAVHLHEAHAAIGNEIRRVDPLRLG